MVTYRVKEGRTEENSSYVREVMADLDGEGPVSVSEASQRFTATLVEDRCAATPELHTMTLVGRYAG
jgi:hypothetical protein